MHRLRCRWCLSGTSRSYRRTRPSRTGGRHSAARIRSARTGRLGPFRRCRTSHRSRPYRTACRSSSQCSFRRHAVRYLRPPDCLRPRRRCRRRGRREEVTAAPRRLRRATVHTPAWPSPRAAAGEGGGWRRRIGGGAAWACPFGAGGEGAAAGPQQAAGRHHRGGRPALTPWRPVRRAGRASWRGTPSFRARAEAVHPR